MHIQVQELETSIKAVVNEIDETKETLKQPHQPKQIDFLCATLLQLGAKEIALRDELKQFRRAVASACATTFILFS